MTNASRKAIAAWCLFEAGGTAFSTVIVTFVFSVYFSRYVAGDEVRGSALWSYALGCAGVVIALFSPVCGAVADHYGPRKGWLAFFSLLCILASALLYTAAPGHVLTALLLLGAGSIGLELAFVFANAMLPGLAAAGRMGRLSGWAWASGYMGGLACLALALAGLVGLGPLKPLLSLPQEQFQHIRATGPLVGLWFAALAVPLFIWIPDAPRSGLPLRDAVRTGLQRLQLTARNARHEKNLFVFLVASALYRDGLNTLFAVGGLYAAGTFGMNFTEILVFAIGLNVTSGLGAAGFAFADDRWGSKRVIVIALCGLLATGSLLLLLHDKQLFIAAALLLGAFVGPAQAASRTLAARLAPPGRSAEIFGLYALTGRATAFAGPFLFGFATWAFDSQRAGVATILLFWLAGLALLTKVREP